MVKRIISGFSGRHGWAVKVQIELYHGSNVGQKFGGTQSAEDSAAFREEAQSVAAGVCDAAASQDDARATHTTRHVAFNDSVTPREVARIRHRTRI